MSAQQAERLRLLIRDVRVLKDDPEDVARVLADEVEALLPQLTTPLWLTPEQAADRLQVHVKWIERAVESGELTEHRRNRVRRYRPQDVDALLQPSTEQDSTKP